MHTKIRLLIADNHRFVADACKRLIEPEFAVVDVAGDGRALVKSALQLKPDGVILEVTLPHLNGIEASRQIKRKLPTLRVIFLAASSEVNVVAEAFRAGASAYLPKRAGAEEFVNAIRRVMRGESYLSPMIARETIDYILHSSEPNPSRPEITAREAEILQLLLEGNSMKQVAALLGIASGTVAFHKYRMMERLGIKSNAGLMQYAMTKNPVPPEAGWEDIRPRQSRFVAPPEHSAYLPASLQGNNEIPGHLRGPARTRRRLDEGYAADIQ
jgi:DNA-binding NarL/FixJ family response regulator